MSDTTIKLGKVQMQIKGTYDTETTYELLDIVNYNNNSYICKASCTNVVPTNTTYWQMLAQGSGLTKAITNLSYDSDTQQLSYEVQTGSSTIELITLDLSDNITQTQGYTTISSGTTITNGLEVTIPVSYVVGSNSLEVYYNGWRLIPKTSDNDDGHYTEVGDSGAESTTIAFYRTDEDGDYTLTEDAHLHCVVKGKNTVEEES